MSSRVDITLRHCCKYQDGGAVIQCGKTWHCTWYRLEEHPVHFNKICNDMHGRVLLDILLNKRKLGTRKKKEDYGKSILTDIDIIIQYLCAHDTASIPFHF